MNTANVATKKNFHKTNSFNGRFNTAKAALDAALKPAETITVVHAVLYQDNARVHYLSDFHQKHCKIMLPDLQAHVLSVYYSTEKISDVSVYYYIEENLGAVCKSYLDSGKEIIAL